MSAARWLVRIVAAAALLAAGAVAASALAPGGADASRPLAAASRSFTDPVDAPPGVPDITAVNVSNDDAGTLIVAITLANRTQLDDGDAVRFQLDTDLNPNTGCGVEGVPRADLLFFVTGQTAVPDTFGMLRCVGGQFDLLTPQGTLTGGFDGGTRTVTFRVNRSDFGSPDALTIWVFGASHSAPELFDAAPDGGPTGFEFHVNPTVTHTTTQTTTTAATQTTTRVLERSPDTARPSVRALPAGARRGRSVRLRYRAFDESGATREEIRIYGARLLSVKRVPLSVSTPANVHSITWRVPRRAPGPFRFCVRAWDRPGNVSSSSCAPVRLK